MQVQKVVEEENNKSPEPRAMDSGPGLSDVRTVLVTFESLDKGEESKRSRNDGDELKNEKTLGS